MTQLITPNPNIPCRPGWCLAYVNEAFGVDKKYPSATSAWFGSKTKHEDRDFPPGVWVPVWYGLDSTPLGHVVLLAPDGSVYSTSDLTTTPHHHPDLADLEAYYAYYGMKLTYRGWTEDVEDTPVISLGGIAAMGSTITPLSEEDAMAFTPEQEQFILTALSDLVDHVVTDAKLGSALAQVPIQVWSYTNPNIPGGDAFQRLRDIPAAVLNQTFKLADGTVTNLAGILTAIHATPAAGTPADPTAVVHALRDQLNK